MDTQTKGLCLSFITSIGSISAAKSANVQGATYRPPLSRSIFRRTHVLRIQTKAQGYTENYFKLRCQESMKAFVLSTPHRFDECDIHCGGKLG